MVAASAAQSAANVVQAGTKELTTKVFCLLFLDLLQIFIFFLFRLVSLIQESLLHDALVRDCLNLCCNFGRLLKYDMKIA